MDKEKLLAPRHDTPHGMPEDDVEIPDVGTVRIRGLNRGEVFQTQQIKGVEAIERRILAVGMIDPELTETEVRQWQRNSPAGEIEPVANAIRNLSGLAEGADKEAYKSVRDESGSGVRALPGDETGDVDGGESAAGDE